MKKLITLSILTLSVLGAECLDHNGIKLNTQTNLMWSTPASTSLTWSGAQTYCSNLVEGVYSNWVLPNINQLESERVNFGETEVCFTPNFEWSTTFKSSTDAYKMDAAHVVLDTDRTNTNPVRCVRSNQ